jgi:hypothetical protein
MSRTAETLQRLGAALADLAALDVTGLSDVEVLAALRAVHPLLYQTEALQTRLIGAAHRRGSAAVDGSVSTQAWLRCRLRLGDAPTQIRVATALPGLPHVADAYGRGEMSFAHAAAITEVASDIQPEVLAGGADKLLAELATALGPSAARRAALRVRDHFDPEAAERRTRRVFEDRWLAVDRTIHGCVSIQGVLDPDGGELVLSTLGALTPPAIPGDTRSPGARRADALVQMCRLAGAVTPEAGGAKPHVAVTIDWQTLRDGLTATVTTPGARLGGGIPIHPSTARRLACDATLIPAVLGSAGEPLDIGRATRLVPAGMRRALVLRDGGCRFPPAIVLHTGQTRITCNRGRRAAPLRCRICSCCVGTTTPPYTKAAGASTTTPQPTPSPRTGPTAPVSTSPANHKDRRRN